MERSLSATHEVQEEEKAAVIHSTEQTHGPDDTMSSRQPFWLVVINDTDMGQAGAASALAS